jgi:hypothetical protein
MLVSSKKIQKDLLIYNPLQPIHLAIPVFFGIASAGKICSGLFMTVGLDPGAGLDSQYVWSDVNACKNSALVTSDKCPSKPVQYTICGTTATIFYRGNDPEGRDSCGQAVLSINGVENEGRAPATNECDNGAKACSIGIAFGTFFPVWVFDNVPQC